MDATGEVFGEAPNIARACRARPEPGRFILITAAVQRQTAGLFVAEDFGARELKGVSELVTLYRLVRASGGGRRGGARALTPLVGREEELDILSRRWERARKGEGQLALVVGEPGIGKSRLIEEFRARLGEAPPTPGGGMVVVAVVTEHAAAPDRRMGPLAVRRGPPRRNSASPISRASLRLVGLDAAEYAPLIAPLVDVPLPQDRSSKFSTRNCAAGNWQAMTALVLAGARPQPAVIAFEDLHWVDPTSLDLLQTLAEPRSAPNFGRLRRCGRSSASPGACVRTTASCRSRRSIARRWRAWSPKSSVRHALARDVVEAANQRTGGVPLFVEELTRLLLERGVEGGPRRSRRPCSSRRGGGSTGSAKRGRSRRSARCSEGVFPVRRCATWLRAVAAPRA